MSQISKASGFLLLLCVRTKFCVTFATHDERPNMQYFCHLFFLVLFAVERSNNRNQKCKFSRAHQQQSLIMAIIKMINTLGAFFRSPKFKRAIFKYNEMEFSTAHFACCKRMAAKKCTYSSYFYCLCDDFVTSFIAHTRTLAVQMGNLLHVWCITARIAKVANLRKWREKKIQKAGECAVGLEGKFFFPSWIYVHKHLSIFVNPAMVVCFQTKNVCEEQRDIKLEKSRKCKEE